MTHIRKKYFSLSFREEDPNFLAEVSVLEHENGIELTDEDIDESGNHFKTEEEAEAVRKIVVGALKLKDEYPAVKWRPGNHR